MRDYHPLDTDLISRSFNWISLFYSVYRHTCGSNPCLHFSYRGAAKNNKSQASVSSQKPSPPKTRIVRGNKPTNKNPCFFYLRDHSLNFTNCVSVSGLRTWEIPVLPPAQNIPSNYHSACCNYGFLVSPFALVCIEHIFNTNRILYNRTILHN